jgi:hypothetical protein
MTDVPQIEGPKGGDIFLVHRICLLNATVGPAV